MGPSVTIANVYTHGYNRCYGSLKKISFSGQAHLLVAQAFALMKPRLDAPGLRRPFQIQGQQPFQYLRVGHIVGPAVGFEDRLVQLLVGQLQPRGAGVV